MKGYAVNNRVNRLEARLEKIDNRITEIDVQLKAQGLPKQGIFFNGQIFDAYVFTSDLIKKAKSSIMLIDNYVDETVLTLLAKRQKDVTASIFTKSISKQLVLDINKHNSQYPEIKVVEFRDAHDRFLLIDEAELYHFGASLKDLGKKCLPSGQTGFAFSRVDSLANEVLNKLGNRA